MPNERKRLHGEAKNKQEEVYDFLADNELYDGSYSDFSAKINTKEGRKTIYDFLHDNELYDDDYNTFSTSMSTRQVNPGVKAAQSAANKKKAEASAVTDENWRDVAKSAGFGVSELGASPTSFSGSDLIEKGKNPVMSTPKINKQRKEITSDVAPAESSNKDGFAMYQDEQGNVQAQFVGTEDSLYRKNQDYRQQLEDKQRSDLQRREDERVAQLKNVQDEIRRLGDEYQALQDESTNLAASENYESGVDLRARGQRDSRMSQLQEQIKSLQAKQWELQGGEQETLTRNSDLLKENISRLYRDEINRQGGEITRAYNKRYNPERTQNERILGEAQRLIEDAETLKLRATQNMEGGTFFGGAIRGLMDSAFDIRTWDNGTYDLLLNKDLNAIFAKHEDGSESAIDQGVINSGVAKLKMGENVTPEEEALMKAKLINLMAHQLYDENLGSGYKAGKVTGESLGFMLEMAVNPMSAGSKTATSTVGRYVGKGLATKYGAWATKGGILQKAANYAINNADKVARSAAMSATTGVGRVGAGMYERNTGDVRYKVDDLGNIVYGGREEGDDMTTAFAKSLTDNIIQNATEMGFGLVGDAAKIGGKAMKAVSKTKPAQAVINAAKGTNVYGKLNNFVKNLTPTEFAKTVSDFEKRTQWHGTFEEYWEEVEGNVLNALTIGDMDFSTGENGVFNRQNNIDTFLGVSLMGGAISALKSFGYRGAKGEAERRFINAEANGQRIWEQQGLGNEWRANIEALNNISDEDLGKEVMSVYKQMADDMKEDPEVADRVKSYFEYVRALQFSRGVNIGTDNANKESDAAVVAAVTDEVENGNVAETPQEQHNVGISLATAEGNLLAVDGGAQIKSLIDGMVEDGSSNGEFSSMLDGMNDEQKKAVNDYLTAKTELQKVNVSVENKIEDAINTERERITPYIYNKEGVDYFMTGQIDGKEVFVKSVDNGKYTVVIPVGDGTTVTRMVSEAEFDKDDDGNTIMPVEHIFNEYMQGVESDLAEELYRDTENKINHNENVVTDIAQGSVVMLANGDNVDEWKVVGQTADGKWKVAKLVPTEAINISNGGQKEIIPYPSKKEEDNIILSTEQLIDMQDAYYDGSMQTEQTAEESNTPIEEDANANNVDENSETPTFSAQNEGETPTFSANIPVDENEEPIFDNASEEDVVDYFNNSGLENDEAGAFLDDYVNSAKEILDAVKAEEPKEESKPKASDYAGRMTAFSRAKAEWKAKNDAAKGEWQKKVDEARAAFDRWLSIRQKWLTYQTDAAIDSSTFKDFNTEKMSLAERENNIGDPQSLDEFIERAAYTFRYLWKDKGATKGLASHLFANAGKMALEEERRKRLRYLSNSDGVTPEMAAHKIAQMARENGSFGQDIDETDVFNKLVDVLLSYNNRGDILSDIEDRRRKQEEDQAASNAPMNDFLDEEGFDGEEDGEQVYENPADEYDNYIEYLAAGYDNVRELFAEDAEEWDEFVKELDNAINELNNNEADGQNSNVGARGSVQRVDGEARQEEGSEGSAVMGVQSQTDNTRGVQDGEGRERSAAPVAEGNGNVLGENAKGRVQQNEGNDGRTDNLAEKELAYNLSDEVDENGRLFVLNSNGNIEFGRIEKESGLTAAPILLSEGMITDATTNAGYGLVHIEARHGDQIRKAGYNSVIDFIEEVGKNYEVIREGKDREGKPTYLLQLTDKHNNTLIVELSGDGTYYNINTAGIFKHSYGAKKNVVYNRHTTVEQSAETADVSPDEEQNGTPSSASMNTPTLNSEGKGSNNIANEQTKEENSDIKEENGGKKDNAAVKEAPYAIADGMGAVASYYGNEGLHELAKKVKEGDPKAISEAAQIMAKYIPSDAVLVPMPSHTGQATTMLDLCNAIAKINGNSVEDVLIGKKRQSSYEAKKNGKPLTKEELGFESTDTLDGENVIIIDNVIASGLTAKAALDVFPNAKVLALAVDVNAFNVASIQLPEGIELARVNQAVYRILDNNVEQNDVSVYADNNKIYLRIVGTGLKKYADTNGYEYDKGNRYLRPSVSIPLQYDNFEEKYQEAKDALAGKYFKTKINTDVKAAVKTSRELYSQYNDLVKKHPDAFIIIKNGDKYEVFDKEADYIIDNYGYEGVTPYSKFKSRAVITSADITKVVDRLVRDGKRIGIEEISVETPQEDSNGADKAYDKEKSIQRLNDARVELKEALGTPYEYQATAKLQTELTYFGYLNGVSMDDLDEWVEKELQSEIENMRTVSNVEAAEEHPIEVSNTAQPKAELTADEIDAMEGLSENQKWLAKDYLGGDRGLGATLAYGKAMQLAKKVASGKAEETKQTTEDKTTRSNRKQRSEKSNGEKKTRKKSVDGSKEAVDDALSELKDVLSRFKKAGNTGRLYVSLIGLTPEQVEMVGELFEAAAKFGYQVAKAGKRKLGEWTLTMKAMIGESLKDATGWEGKEADEFLKEVWDTKYLMDGKRIALSEHIANMDKVEKADPVEYAQTKTNKEEHKKSKSPVGIQLDLFADNAPAVVNTPKASKAKNSKDTIDNLYTGYWKAGANGDLSIGEVSYSNGNVSYLQYKLGEMAKRETMPLEEFLAKMEREGYLGNGTKYITTSNSVSKEKSKAKTKTKKVKNETEYSSTFIDGKSYTTMNGYITGGFVNNADSKTQEKLIRYNIDVLKDKSADNISVASDVSMFDNDMAFKTDAGTVVIRSVNYDRLGYEMFDANGERINTSDSSLKTMDVLNNIHSGSWEYVGQRPRVQKVEQKTNREVKERDLITSTDPHKKGMLFYVKQVDNESKLIVAENENDSMDTTPYYIRFDEVGDVVGYIDRYNHRQSYDVQPSESPKAQESKVHSHEQMVKAVENDMRDTLKHNPHMLDEAAEPYTTMRIPKWVTLTEKEEREIWDRVVGEIKATDMSMAKFKVGDAVMVKGKGLRYVIGVSTDGKGRFYYDLVMNKGDEYSHEGLSGYINEAFLQSAEGTKNDAVEDVDAINGVKRPSAIYAGGTEEYYRQELESAKIRFDRYEGMLKHNPNNRIAQRGKEVAQNIIDYCNEWLKVYGKDVVEHKVEGAESGENDVSLQSTDNTNINNQNVEENDVRISTVGERSTGQQSNENGALGESSGNADGRTDGRSVGRRDGSHNSNDGKGGSGLSRTSESKSLGITNPRNTNNNHAERGTDYAPKSPAARFKANVAAIKLMKELVKDGKQATPQQMEVLRKFSGWGGLGQYINDRESVGDILTDEEYEQAVMSINSAYYTPSAVIDAMWDVARKLGFKGGKVLEGSAGIGNIIGLMPTEMSERSDITAVEIDGVTGNILKLLYPDANVHINGFEKTKVANASIDLAITNVPFVTGLRVSDDSGDNDLSKKFHNIHDFCIAKNVRKLRPGGIGIFISSSGTLDKSTELRKWVTTQGDADFIGAFRLNNETFGGTGATSDIIIIRRRVNGKQSPFAQDFSSTDVLRSAEYDTGDTKEIRDPKTGRKVTVADVRDMALTFNSYFVAHPEFMGGEMAFNFEKGVTRFPTSVSLFPVKGIDQNDRLTAWVDSIKEMQNEGVQTESARTEQEMLVASMNEKLGEGVKEGSLILDSKGNPCVARLGEAVPLEGKTIGNKVKGRTKAECIGMYNAIKDALANVLDYQSQNADDKGLAPLMKALNNAYDKFTKVFGRLSKNSALSFLKNDVDFSSIAALEKVTETGDKEGNRIINIEKTDVFRQRVVGVTKEMDPKNISDAVVASIFKNGYIDTAYIADKLGISEEEAKKQVLADGHAFEDPLTKRIEVDYEYLSGNVRQKIADCEANNEDGKYNDNIKALERVKPMDIPAHLIEFNIGSNWVPSQLFVDFIEDKTGKKVRLTKAGGTWSMGEGNEGGEKNKTYGVYSEVFRKTIWGTTLIEAAMRNTTISVTETHKQYDGTTETVKDKDATTAANNKVNEIRADFREWAKAKMQSDPELAAQIERIYNDKFNNYVPKSIPKSYYREHLDGSNHAITLYPHQSAAVTRAVTEPLLLAHEVGTGKTFTLISTAMEMRRLGTAKKPMIVVQNATVGQFVKDAKLLYPNAKVLSIEDGDRTADGRKNFYAKIKYNDWDMIVVPQSVFERIPDAPKRQVAFIEAKIAEKMAILEQMKEDKANAGSMILRQAQKEIDNLMDELVDIMNPDNFKKDNKTDKKKEVAKQNAAVRAQEMLDRAVDDVENFDDMDVDAILVDEAHEYKHLGFATAMQRGVKGVDPSYSKKSQGVYLKCQAVKEKNNGRNVVFATGTPISNTAAEVWTFMKYLMPEEAMKDYGIYYFDDFVRNFGNITQMLEFTTSGSFKENNRFAGYVNTPELIRIWNMITDTVLTEEAGKVSEKIPTLEGGKAQDIFLPQSKSLRSIMKSVRAELEAFEKMDGKEKAANSHIPLVMYGIASKAAIDTRLVWDNAPDEPLSKTNRAVEETLATLEKTKDYKGTVAIFCDAYRNKRSGFNVYEEIKRKLVEKGVPSEQIFIMKSGMSVKKKQEIFDKVNAGEIRVILGSTQTLGTGVNIQERLHTLIHMDVPNRPMDYTQRNGRILRQGNLHKQWDKTVRVLRFGVEDSLDVTGYQRLKTKGAIADSVMRGKQMLANNQENRSIEEEEDMFGDAVATLSGSEYAMLKNQTEREYKKYENKKKQWEADQVYIANTIRRCEGQNREAEGRIKAHQQVLDILEAKAPEGGKSVITIGGKTFASLAEMDDMFKEINKKQNERSAELKQQAEGGLNGKAKLTNVVKVGDLEFVFTTNLSTSGSFFEGKFVVTVHRETTYSCDDLNLVDVPVSGGYVKAGVEDVINNVVTGGDARERINAAQRSIESNNELLATVRKREGKPFEYDKELEEAKNKVDEYTELMQQEMAKKEAKYADDDVEGVDLNVMDNGDDEGEGDEARFARAWHGSASDFEKFDLGFALSGEGSMVNGYGVYVASLKGTAERYATLNTTYNHSGVKKDVVLIDGKMPTRGTARYVDMILANNYVNDVNDIADRIKYAYKLDAPRSYNEDAETRQARKAIELLESGRVTIGKAPSLLYEIEIPDDNGSNYIEWASDDVEKNTAILERIKDDLKEAYYKRNGNVEDKRYLNYNFNTQYETAINDGEIYQLVSNLLNDDKAASKFLSDHGFVGIKVLTGYNSGNAAAHDGAYNYVIFDENDVEIVNKTSFSGSDIETKNHTNAETDKMQKAVESTAKDLNTPVKVVRVESEVEALKGISRASKEILKREGKGMFNTKTGEVIIYLPKNADAKDAVKTLLHEVVGHKGLRTIVGEGNYNAFLKKLYRDLPIEARTQINNDAIRKYGYDVTEALDEMLAEMAEKNETPSWWNKVVAAVRNMLREVGINVKLNENDVKYLLWQSKNQLKRGDIVSEAVSRAMRRKLGINKTETNKKLMLAKDEASTYEVDGNGEVRLRKVDDSGLIEWFDKQPKITTYKTVAVDENGEMHAPMADNVSTTKTLTGKVKTGNYTFGDVLEAEENPDLVDEKGKIKIQREDGKTLDVAYDPYDHSSDSMINDQFKSAWERDNLVVIEQEIPASEIEGDDRYHADKALLPTGKHNWKKGVVGNKLPDADSRHVYLSRWSRPIKPVDWQKVADEWIDKCTRNNIDVPFNVVPKAIRDIIADAGVNIIAPEKGMGQNCFDAYEEWKNGRPTDPNNPNGGGRNAATKGGNDALNFAVSKETRTFAAENGISDEVEECVKIMDAFNAENKDVADTYLILSKDEDGVRRELKSYGVSDEDIDYFVNTYMEAIKQGVIGINWHNADKVVLLTTKRAKEQLWHENIHRILKRMGIKHDELINRLYDAILPVDRYECEDIRKRYSELYTSIGLDPNKRELDLREECVVGFLARNIAAQENEKQFDSWLLLNAKFGNLKENDLISDIYKSVKYGTNTDKLGGNDHDGRGTVREGTSRGNIRPSHGYDKTRESEQGQTDNPLRFNFVGQNVIDTTDEGTNIVAHQSGAARDMYERSLQQGSYKFQEAWQDSMLGLKKLMSAVMAAEGKTYDDVADWENAYMAENLMSSVNQAEFEAYRNLLYSPMLEVIGKILKNGAEYDDVKQYLVSKHGLERNEVFAKRDAEKEAREAVQYDETMAQLQKDFDEENISEDEYEEGKAALKQRYEDKYNELYDKNRDRDYSGLTALYTEDGEEDIDIATLEERAQEYVDKFEGEHSEYIADLWDKINACNSATLDKQLSSGMINQVNRDMIGNMFKYYVPLRGFDETTSDEVYDYLQHSQTPMNTPIKAANGRKSLADDPIATIGNMAESGIMAGNRNLMKQKFLNFVEGHKTDAVSISEVYLHRKDTPEGDEWEMIGPEYEKDDTAEQMDVKRQKFLVWFEQQREANPGDYKVGKEAANMKYKTLTKFMGEHAVVVKRGGKDYVITINGNPRAAQCINGLTNPHGNDNRILRKLEEANRYLASMATNRNVAFVLTNFCRDAVFANTMVEVKEDHKYAKRYHANWASVSMRMGKLVYKYKNNTLDMNDPMERAYYDFVMNGGETGYTVLNSVDEYKSRITDELNLDGRKTISPKKALETLDKVLDLPNRVAEDTSRFAAFLTSREMGRSMTRSIYDAKEITVNFNKKGAGNAVARDRGNAWNAAAAQDMRSLFMFFNAGVQGLTNYCRAAKKNPKKFAAMCNGLCLSGVLVPVASMALSAMMGGDDDDYWNIPEYVRRQNICICFGKTTIKIPLAIEQRAFYGLGELIIGQYLNHTNYRDGQFVYKSLQQMSQVLPLDMLEGDNAETWWMPFVPSWGKPITEVIANTSWTGVPIEKQTPWNENMPNWTKAYKGTSPLLVSMAEAINEFTGGDIATKGIIDPDPAQIEHLATGYLGGLGMVLNQAVKTIQMPFNEDMREVRNVPVVNRFIATSDSRAEERRITSEYFDNNDRMEKIADRERGYNSAKKKTKDPTQIAEINSLILKLTKSDEYTEYKKWKMAKKEIDRVAKDPTQNDKRLLLMKKINEELRKKD